MFNDNRADKTVKILFLGQCLQYGYQGVSRYATYPNVAASILKAQFPSVKFKFDLKYLHHPSGLKAILRHRLPVTRPDFVVINLPAMFAATCWRVNLVYEIAPEIVDTARSFVRKVEAKIKGVGTGALNRETAIDKMIGQKPPIPLDEYERIVAEAISHANQISPCRIIFMGPGAFNEDTIENYEIHSPELWSSVNEMVIRLTGRFNLPMIDVQGVLAGHSGEVFLNENHRFSEQGHAVVGREVASVLAAEVRMKNLGGAMLSGAARV
jgi:hypothetical protein